MRDDNFPDLVSDPEAEGLPGAADDDSTAYDEADSPRQSDGPEPAPLPADAPLAVDRFGTTPEEQRLGESLDLKLARENDDPGLSGDAAPRPDTVDAAAESFDAETLSEDLDRVDPATAPLGDGSYVEPDLDSPVSLYDRPDFLADDGGTVGRIVEPDQGFGEDTEKDAIAFDAGAAGGGASAEELAMHEVREF